VTERQWAMTKIGPGDWAWPSNDGLTLWRAIKVEERDGTLSTAAGKVINGDFWTLLRFRHPAGSVMAGDFESRWDNEVWEVVDSMLPTRQAAIDESMGISN